MKSQKIDGSIFLPADYAHESRVFRFPLSACMTSSFLSRELSHFGFKPLSQKTDLLTDPLFLRGDHLTVPFKSQQ